MIRKILILLALASPCLAQTMGTVNGVPAQSLANMGGTQTAGAGGVTANTFVSADSSAPTRFVASAAGTCGAGVALSTAAAGASFTLSDALGTVQVKTDAGGAVAGHLLVGSTVTPGLAMDSGQTSSLNISAETTVCGTALTTVSGGSLVTMNPRGRGSYGHKTDQMNGASLPTSGGVTTTNASGQLVALKQIAALWGFGDSWLQGRGTTNGDVVGTMGLLARDTPAPMFNFAKSGSYVSQIELQAFTNFAPHPALPSVCVMNGGLNDTTLGTSTALLQNYTYGLYAMEAWCAIPYQRKLMASTASQSGGTWTTSTTVPLYINPVLTSPGTAMSTSTSGAALTFSVPSWSTTKLGITYVVTNASAGTFTVSVDGAAQTDAISGTTTFSAAPPTALSGVASAPFRQEFTVTPNTTHTVVITNTSSAAVPIIDVDGIPPASQTNTNAVFVSAADSNWTNYASYNAASLAVATQLKNDGLPVFYVDLVTVANGGTGNPGVNTTTDQATTATATCPASSLTNHPNDCGHVSLEQTIYNTELANNYVFSTFRAGGPTQVQPYFNGPINITVNSIATAGRAAVFSNVNRANPYIANNSGAITGGPNGSGVLGAGIDMYNDGTNTFGFGMGVDGSTGLPYSGKIITKAYGTRDWFCVQKFTQTTVWGESSYASAWCAAVASGDSYQLGVATAKGFATLVSTVTASSTPALDATKGLQTITLSANATPTITGLAAGQDYTLQVCQPATGGPFTWAAPAAMHGALSSASIAGMAAGTCAVQNFKSFSGSTLEATSAGVTGIAP